MPPAPEAAAEVRAPAGGRARPAAPPAKKKGATARSSHGAGAPETAAAPAVSPPAAPTAPAASKKPDCNPNYYFDAQARKHFKPECF